MISFEVRASIEDEIQKGHEAFEAKDYQKAFEIWHDIYEGRLESLDQEKTIDILDLVAKSLTHQYKMKEALPYVLKADSIAQANNLRLKHYELLTSKMSLWTFLGDRKKVLEAAQNGLLQEDLPSNLRSEFNTSIGYYYEYVGDYHSALEFHKKAYEMDKEKADSSSLPFTALATGISYGRLGNSEKGIALMLEGISWLRSPKDEFKKATIYWRIQELFLEQRNYDKALEYGLKGVAEAEKHKLVMTKARILKGLSGSYVSKGDLNAAMDAIDEAVRTFISKNAPSRIYKGYNEKARIFRLMEKPDSAWHYLELAKKMEGEIPFVPSDMLKHSFERGQLLFETGQIDKALDQFLHCEELSEKQSNPYWKKDVNSMLSKVYHELGQDGLAYKYLRKQQEMRDSLFVLERNLIINELETKFRTSQQKGEIDALSVKNERQKSVNYLTITGLILSLIIGGFLFGLYRLNKRNKHRLEEKNTIIEKSLEEKELLLKEIHHRVKNNLQIISSLLNLQTKFVEDDNALSALNDGKNRVRSMALIHQNLYQDHDVTGIEIKSYFEDLCHTLFESYNISEGQIELISNIEDISLDVDTVIPLGLIVNELITNALKYAFPENRMGQILIDLKEKNEKVYLSVKDNGLGFKKEDFSNRKSFGHKLIQAFLKKLDATINFDGTNGTDVSLVISKYKKVA